VTCCYLNLGCGIARTDAVVRA